MFLQLIKFHLILKSVGIFFVASTIISKLLTSALFKVLFVYNFILKVGCLPVGRQGTHMFENYIHKCLCMQYMWVSSCNKLSLEKSLPFSLLRSCWEADYFEGWWFSLILKRTARGFWVSIPGKLTCIFFFSIFVFRSCLRRIPANLTGSAFILRWVRNIISSSGLLDS